ncbi:MAG: hypothetical protein M0C28_20090 [Candidatus Moduliflexus flocculans]|nr:hypothetical protein [Candidatus Moduliflexus flocculans]
MLVNVLPPLLFADPNAKAGFLGLSLPLAGIFILDLHRLHGRGRDDGLAPHLRVHRGHRPQGAGRPLPRATPACRSPWPASSAGRSAGGSSSATSTRRSRRASRSTP